MNQDDHLGNESAGDETLGRDQQGEPPARGWLTRRQMLALAGAGAVAGAGYLASCATRSDESAGRKRKRSKQTSTTEAQTSTVPPSTVQQTSPPGPAVRWSDPATWDGRLPGPGDVAVIDRAVVLDIDPKVAGVRVEAGGDLSFDAAASHTLETTGNVEVHGALRMKPANAGVNHRLAFAGVDEARFVGGHAHHAVATDVGLWVLGAGQLDLAGAPKTAWTRLTGPASKGAATIDVADAKAWVQGDEIVVTPTEPVTVDDHWLHYDRRVVQAISGNRITLDRPLEFPHPATTVRPGVTYQAEVLNLSRNVRIEGTPKGRAHVFITSSQPQTVRWAGLRHLGPQKNGEQVLSRYSLHFHMSNDGSRGSTVEGAVAYDGGNHSFVAHLSNGVSFRDCVAHDQTNTPYWWDLGADGEGRDSVPSDDILYERCVAHHVKPGANQHSLNGFLIGAGRGNVARGCVATGVQGGSEGPAGYEWPSHSRDKNTWVFQDNVAHNNRGSGIYYWQNNVRGTVVDRFVAYNCGHGIIAGSYNNIVTYRDVTIYGCRSVGLSIVAIPGNPRPGETIVFQGVHVDQANLSDYAVMIGKHLADAATATRLEGCTFKGGRKAQVALPDGGKRPQLYNFLNCRFAGNEFWLADDVPANTALKVKDATRSIVIRRGDQRGTDRGQWNAAVATA